MRLTVPLKDNKKNYENQKRRFTLQLAEASANCGVAALVSLLNRIFEYHDTAAHVS